MRSRLVQFGLPPRPRRQRFRPITRSTCSALLTASPAFAQEKEHFVPVLVYRIGVYAPNGVPFANGYVDYLKLVNARGGMNGVKIS